MKQNQLGYIHSTAYNEETEYIVGIGEALWDMLPAGKQIGGAPANFAYHVSQLGLKSCVVSAIGCDKLGDEIVSNFNNKNLTYLLAKTDKPTGTVQVTLTGDGIPCYEIMEGVAWDNIPFSAELENLARHARAVCFGSLAQRQSVSANSINHFLDLIPNDGKHLKIFDINLRQSFYTKETIENSLQKCNILKINDEEIISIAHLFGYQETDMQSIARMLKKEYDLQMLILTCGINGSYVFHEGGMSFLETPRVEVADTVGAGDSFTAAFVTSLLQGREVCEAHKKAVELSAFVCTQKGAMPAYKMNL